MTVDEPDGTLPAGARTRMADELFALASQESRPSRWAGVVAVAAVVAVLVSGGSYAATHAGSAHRPAPGGSGGAYVPPVVAPTSLPHRPGMVAVAQAWTAARTDPESLVVVVSYVGGACDGPVRLRATERADAVVLALSVERGHQVCPEIGIARTAAVQLHAPLAARSVIDAASKPEERRWAYDGSHLLTPTGLPADFALGAQRGVVDEQGNTTAWRRGYFPPALPLVVPTPGDDPRCDSRSRPSVWLTQGDGATSDATGWSSVATVKIGGADVEVLQDDSGNSNAVHWRDALTDTSVSLTTSVGCAGGRPFTPAELARLAGSLRLVRDGEVVQAAAAPHGTATVSGTLAMTGGVVNAVNPVAGRVMFRDAGGRVTTVAAGDDGRFSVMLPLGTYAVTGRAPMFNGGRQACRAMAPVTVTAAGRVGVLVACDRK